MDIIGVLSFKAHQRTMVLNPEIRMVAVAMVDMVDTAEVIGECIMITEVRVMQRPIMLISSSNHYVHLIIMKRNTQTLRQTATMDMVHIMDMVPQIVDQVHPRNVSDFLRTSCCNR